MQLYTINTGYFKLDGGAMFGVVPKSMWEKLCTPDKNNLCSWALRCLLIENGKRLMLVDTGIGNKQDERFRSHYEPHGTDTLLLSLKRLGFHSTDITDVLLTHLHFDHCGGATELNDQKKPKLSFPNATYWSSSEHWNWAIHPNPREKASFLKENLLPIMESGHLKFIENENIEMDGITLHQMYGHTESMTICDIQYKDRIITYAADLIPSRHHIKLPYVMAYDIRPLETIREKEIFLNRAYENKHIIMFEHDKEVECCDLIKRETGIVFESTFKLNEI